MSLEINASSDSGSDVATLKSKKLYSESWMWRAVESLITAKNFNPSPKAIARRLNITVEQAVESLEGLEKIGVISRQNNTYIKKIENITEVDQKDLEKAELLEVHSKLAPQIISKLDENSIFTTQISLGTLEIVRKHRSKLIEFLDLIDSDASELENPDVLAIEISIAKISSDAGSVQ